MEFHPIANVFPMLAEAELRELAADIKRNGQLHPITLHEGMILDGRNRYRACGLAGVEPDFVDYSGDDPVAFVVSENIKRRHLDTSQRAMAAAALATLPKGVKLADRSNDLSQNDAARLLNVSTPSVKRARIVSEKGPEELKQAVWAGDVSVSKAAEIASKPARVEALVDRLSRGVPVEDAILATAKDIRADRTYERREKNKAIVEKAVKEMPPGVYRVIYADPPWQYGKDGHPEYGTADTHYPTMSTDEICAMSIPAADNAVCFLWSTSPLLPDGLKVLESWGFTYKASFVWDKIKHNFGHYNSIRHEFLLVGTKGSCLPDLHKLHDSVQAIERTGHSVKPERFREIIDEIYCLGPRIELFARVKYEGWASWGAEV